MSLSLARLRIPLYGSHRLSSYGASHRSSIVRPSKLLLKLDNPLRVSRVRFKSNRSKKPNGKKKRQPAKLDTQPLEPQPLEPQPPSPIKGEGRHKYHGQQEEKEEEEEEEASIWSLLRLWYQNPFFFWHLIFCLTCSIYVAHLERVPITGRWRFHGLDYSFEPFARWLTDRPKLQRIDDIFEELKLWYQDMPIQRCGRIFERERVWYRDPGNLQSLVMHLDQFGTSHISLGHDSSDYILPDSDARALMVQRVFDRIKKSCGISNIQDCKLYVVEDDEQYVASSDDSASCIHYPTGDFVNFEDDGSIATTLGHELGHLIANHCVDSFSMHDDLRLRAVMYSIAQSQLIWSVGRIIFASLKNPLTTNSTHPQSPPRTKFHHVKTRFGRWVTILFLLGATGAWNRSNNAALYREEGLGSDGERERQFTKRDVKKNHRIEYEADHIGLRIMAQAGYKPDAAITYWRMHFVDDKKLHHNYESRRSTTHPTTKDRLYWMKKWLPDAQEDYRRAVTGE